MQGAAGETTPSDEVEVPDARTLKRLKLSAEVAWFLLSRGYELPKHPPLFATPDGSVVDGAMFDPEAVDRVIASLKVLRHTKGALAGQPLAPAAWQVAYILAPVFGWLKLNQNGRWVRVVRTLFAELPRKNGKTTISAGLGLYLAGADGEQGAEVIAAASSRDQASFAFQPAKTLVEKTPALRGKFLARTNRILHPATSSVFQVITAVADTQHGANISGGIVDELHVHKKRDLVDAIETGTASREQPLIIMITTADDGKPNSIYAVKRRMVEQLASGVLKDPSTYGVVFGLPPKANPLNPANWPKANPGYPISPTHEYLEQAARKAKTSPVELALFKRLHAGQRTKQTTSFIDLKKWDANQVGRKPVATDIEELRGRIAFGGLDLGAVSDLTALCWLLPEEDGAYRAFWRFWCPEDVLPMLDKRTAGEASTTWVDGGWLTPTPGNVTDYDWIKQAVKADAEILDVTTIGLDMWNATQLANDLQAEGLPLMKVRQGFQTMAPAMQEMLRRVLKKELRHDGNPVMRWCVDNLAVATDPAGNVKPDKANSNDKIDGVAALANALSEAINTDRERSAYDEHELLII